jgi:probable phosphoglycerate mutase
VEDVFIATHTESVHHVEGLVGGWYDTPLTERGRRDAHLLAGAMARRVAPGAALLVASDLRRAAETAQIVGASIRAPVVLDARLREISFGAAGGKPQRWLDERIVLPSRVGPRLDHVICEGAETRRRFATRIYDAMRDLHARPERTVVIITHGFAMTFVVAWWLGLPVENADLAAVRASPGGITHLRQAPPFWNRSLELLDDTSHLSANGDRPPR